MPHLCHAPLVEFPSGSKLNSPTNYFQCTALVLRQGRPSVSDPPMHSLSSLGETRTTREVIILNYSFLNTPFTPTPKEHKSQFQSCHFSLGHTWRETRGTRAPFPPTASLTTRDQNIRRISPFSTFLSRMFSLKSILGHVPAVSAITVPSSCCPHLMREGGSTASSQPHSHLLWGTSAACSAHIPTEENMDSSSLWNML